MQTAYKNDLASVTNSQYAMPRSKIDISQPNLLVPSTIEFCNKFVSCNAVAIIQYLIIESPIKDDFIIDIM